MNNNLNNNNETSYLGPFITMVVLFFFVGFLTTANGQFQGPLKSVFLDNAGDLENSFATLITFSWFLAYPLTGKIGTKWVNKFGYKKTLIRSLIVMIVGLAFFYSSSLFTDVSINILSRVVPVGFFIFLIGAFVVGSGVTILQVVINPYLADCKVRGTQAIQRINIGGSANSIGTTFAPFFVTAIVFQGVTMKDVEVSQIQMPFLALITIIGLLTFCLTKMTLPDIKGTRIESGEKLEKSVWSFSHLKLGVIAIFFYVGVEVAIGANINLYAMEQEKNGTILSFFGKDSLTIFGVEFAIPALMATLYWASMLIGRLISSSLSRISSKIQLTITSISSVVFVGLAILTDNPWLLVVVGLFHSVMWAAIFTLSINKLGKYTSIASGVFMMGVIGGAIIPLLQGILADVMNGWRWTWFVVVSGELFILYYALWGAKIKQQAE